MKNFKSIDQKLCTYCGSCISICPTSALSAGKDHIIFNKSKCISCGKCVNICPGISFNFNKYFKKFFKGTKFDKNLGPYLNCYVGHSTDQKIRKRGSSGGIVTTLLVNALEKNLIDAAVVIRMSPNKKRVPEIFIADTEEKIRTSAQSKYVLIPTNHILSKLDPKKRYALVCLPCQAQGLRKMQLEHPNKLKNIKCVIALFCGFNMIQEATDFMIAKTGVEKEEIKEIRYRDGPWPGGFTIFTKDGKMLHHDIFYYHYLNPTFLPKRCMYCPDIFGEVADISCGDSWLPELYEKRNFGWSGIVVRTEAGKKFFSSVIKSNKILAKEVDSKRIWESFPFLINYKKRGYFIRALFNKPEYNLKAPKMSVNEKIKHLGFYLFLLFVTSGFFRTMLRLVNIHHMRRVVQIAKKIAGYPPNARDKFLK